MDKPNSLPRSILDLPMEVRAEMALREAVRGALEEKARLGLPAYIWREGKVVTLSPDDIREHLAKPEPPLSTLHKDTERSEPGGKAK